MTPERLRERWPEGGLFRQTPGESDRRIPWRVSPEPLRLPAPLLRQLEGLGHVLARFQDASHDLYLRSAAGEEAPWLAPILEAGKPDWLVAAQRALSGQAARVIRPDLLWCERGFALSELDSVPGGMGVALFLARAYADAGFDVLGGAEGMAQGFAAAHPEGAVIAVSDESADYRPEMEYLSRALGSAYPCRRAEDLRAEDLPEGATLYRFFELFDHASVPAARQLVERAASGDIVMSPPPVEHLEEKAWLALLHLPGLRSSWSRRLRGAHLRRLLELVPHGWLPDPAPLPPQAALPWLNLGSWEEVAALSQKERRLVLKVSGFDPLAWGARGVTIGHDVSSRTWRDTLRRALADFPRRLWILQDFCETRLVEHPYYAEDGSLALMRGRVRLCPYYFREADGSTRLRGCLATIVPADKKKIHGMTDAIFAPCLTMPSC